MKTNKKENTVLTDIIALNTREILSRYSELVLANKTGLTIQVKKGLFHFSEKERKKLLDMPVELFLSQYEIPFYGEIESIWDLEDNLIEIKVRFLPNTPIYYRECMGELLN